MKPQGEPLTPNNDVERHESIELFEGGGMRCNLEAGISSSLKYYRLFQVSKNVRLLFRKEVKAYDNIDAF
jgi:hypothetical protein